MAKPGFVTTASHRMHIHRSCCRFLGFGTVWPSWFVVHVLDKVYTRMALSNGACPRASPCGAVTTHHWAGVELLLRLATLTYRNGAPFSSKVPVTA